MELPRSIDTVVIARPVMKAMVFNVGRSAAPDWSGRSPSL